MLRKNKTQLRNEFLKNATVGTILSTSWGYDQTNWDFFQVVKRRGKSTFELRELKKNTAHNNMAMTSVNTPIKDNFLDDNVITKRSTLNQADYLSLEYGVLRIWDKKPKLATHYA